MGRVIFYALPFYAIAPIVLHTKDTNNKKRKQHKKQTPRKPTHKQDPDIAIKHVSTVWVMGVTARG